MSTAGQERTLRGCASTLLAIATLVLAGCKQGYQAQYEQQASAQPVTVVRPIEHGDRIQVTRLSVFGDDLAYNDLRGVYLIHDNETGQDFLGISGIGISELGSHRSGKTTHGDER